MKKTRLGIIAEDKAYGARFVRYIMNHYSSEIDLYEYTEVSMLPEEAELDALLYSGGDEVIKDISVRPVFVLVDLESDDWQQEEGIYIVDKYQEVNKIIEDVLGRISEEVRQVRDAGRIVEETHIFGVYSLSENDYQLPFTAMLGNIVSESKKTIVIDVQENSGLKKTLNMQNQKGLEELIVMIENERFSRNLFSECIVHEGRLDYIYPVVNTESLCEISSASYIKMLQFISKEMGYECLVINFGSRFQGFYEVLNICSQIFLIQKQGGLGQWREYEFIEDINERGYKRMLEKVVKIEPPIVTMPVDSCNKIVEQWKWTEFGDMIRGLSVGAVQLG